MVTRRRLAASLAVALIAFAAAVLTMLPGVAYWDTGELQAVAPLLGTAHPTGFPTYVLLGWLASVLLQPFGEPAFRMNLLSGLCLAVAAGFTVDLVRALTGRLVLGIAAGIGLALTPIAWAIATHAEAHTLHLALVAVAALAPRRVGRAGPRARRPRTRRPGRPLPARRDGRLRAGRRQPFADPAVGHPGRALRPRRRSRDLASRQAGPGLRRAARGDRRPRLPRAAAARRAVQGGPRVRHAEHLGRLPLHRPRRAVPGQPVRPVRRAATQARRARRR